RAGWGRASTAWSTWRAVRPAPLRRPPAPGTTLVLPAGIPIPIPVPITATAPNPIPTPVRAQGHRRPAGSLPPRAGNTWEGQSATLRGRDGADGHDPS